MPSVNANLLMKLGQGHQNLYEHLTRKWLQGLELKSTKKGEEVKALIGKQKRKGIFQVQPLMSR